MEVLTEQTAAEFRGQIIDSKGRPIGSELTAATVTLYENAAGTIINSRENQNVLNASNGVYTPTASITGVTLANPVRLKVVGHPFLDGDRVHIAGIVGTTELNGRVYEIRRYSDDEIELLGVDGRGFSSYTSGGTIKAGLLVLNLQPADNVIVGVLSGGQRERHVLQFVLTVSGQASRVEHAFEVEQRPKP